MPTLILADFLGIWPLGIWDFQFAAPLWLLAPLLILPVWLMRRRLPVSVLVIPGAAAWTAGRRLSVRRWPYAAAVLGFVFLAVALARPQRIDDRRVIRGEGYDIVLALDLSTSMLAEDGILDGRQVNRLEALTPVIEAFIRQRPADRIGLVVFSGRAYTLAPLTHDHAWLGRQLARLRIGLIEDGTAIGDGLGLALSRLTQTATTDAPRAGAFAILLTDGANNKGQLTPAQATALATAKKVPVYTIGVGRDGIVPFPAFNDAGQRVGTGRMRSDLDETELRRIAADTGGRYFRADDPDTSTAAFRAIDQTQKITFDARSQLLTTELYFWPAAVSAACLFLASLARLRRSES
jgi:Ca-activated chloride channel family protein